MWVWIHEYNFRVAVPQVGKALMEEAEGGISMKEGQIAIGWVVAHCDKCEIDFEWPVLRVDLDQELAALIGLWLSLPPTARARLRLLFPEIRKAICDIVKEAHT